MNSALIQVSEFFGVVKKKINCAGERGFSVFCKKGGPLMFQGLPLETVKMKSSSALISSLLDGLLAVAAGMAILFLIVGGIRYVRSWGDAEQLTKAKRSVYFVVLGLVVILVSYAVVVTLDKIIKGT
jgi:hypothetical protein